MGWHQVDSPKLDTLAIPRKGAAMAYDPIHHLVVLFGGSTGTRGRFEGTK
jgi:hypothetical protein